MKTVHPALIVVLMPSVVLAEPGDPYHRAEWCHTSGENGIHYGTGDCDSAIEDIESVPGYTVKGCTDLTESSAGPNGTHFLEAITDPALIDIGPLFNLGVAGQGVSILFNPGSVSTGSGPIFTAARMSQGSLELAAVPLPQAVIAADIRGVQMYRAGEIGVVFPYRGNEPLIQDIQGDLELFLHVQNPNDPTAEPVLVRHPVMLAGLSFSESTLPCSDADANGDMSIDVFDLILFLQNFDPNANCPGGTPCQIADIDGNGAIDVFDLIAFLQAFDPRDPNCQGDATPA